MREVTLRERTLCEGVGGMMPRIPPRVALLSSLLNLGGDCLLAAVEAAIMQQKQQKTCKPTLPL